MKSHQRDFVVFKQWIKISAQQAIYYCFRSANFESFILAAYFNDKNVPEFIKISNFNLESFPPIMELCCCQDREHKITNKEQFAK